MVESELILERKKYQQLKAVPSATDLLLSRKPATFKIVQVVRNRLLNQFYSLYKVLHKQNLHVVT